MPGFFNPNGVTTAALIKSKEAAPQAIQAPTASPSPGGSIPKSTTGVFEYKYNSQPHNVEIYLENSGVVGGTSRFPINPSAILNLTIVDILTDWVVGGKMHVLYVPGGKGSAGANLGQSTDTTTKGAQQNGEVLDSYEFRADGFDLLRVVIYPIDTSEATAANMGDSGGKVFPDVDVKDKTKWLLSYLFSVSDIEDVENIPELKGPMGPYIKCARLTFHDVRQQILKTTNLEYSTALNPNANWEAPLANKGALFTGEALLEVFNKALINAENGGAPVLKIDALLGAGAQGPTSPNTSVWDKGGGELFYTSPAQYTAEDDIDYLLANHVSEKPLKSSGENSAPGAETPKDFCVLHTQRPSEETQLEKICLVPLGSLFEKAGSTIDKPGELQYEHFFVTGDTEAPSTADQRNAPISNDPNSPVDIKTVKYGQIISYSFVDISPAVNSEKFRTTPVYSVDVGKRIFNVEFQNNDVLSARKLIAGSYIDQLYKIKGNAEENFSIQIHTGKKTVNVFPTFSLNGDNKVVRQRNGLHSLLYTGLFQNLCICFKTLGLTLRESGTFIGIDKANGAADNDYNNKLYGQWLIVKVDHVFEAGVYTNVIYAVKVHRARPAKNPFKGVM